MKIQYTCPDGSLTVAHCPATALLHWYMRRYHMLIYKKEIPDRTSGEFLSKVFGLILEKYGCYLPKKEVNLLKDSHSEICLKVLEWLYANTDSIKTLKVE